MPTFEINETEITAGKTKINPVQKGAQIQDKNYGTQCNINSDNCSVSESKYAEKLQLNHNNTALFQKSNNVAGYYSPKSKPNSVFDYQSNRKH